MAYMASGAASPRRYPCRVGPLLTVEVCKRSSTSYNAKFIRHDHIIKGAGQRNGFGADLYSGGRDRLSRL